MNFVRSAPRFQEYGSFDALARRLLSEMPEPTDIKARSLSAKIGQLDKGKTEWWLPRVPFSQALARLLEVSLSDLNLEGRSRRHEFAFREFPGLTALDLRQEAPYVVGRAVRVAPPSRQPYGEGGLDKWLDDSAGLQWRPPHEMDWLHVADDLERRLLAARLEVRGRHEVLFVHTLSEATERLREPTPLVAYVEADGGPDDLLALSHRPRSAGLLVIAPFMPAEQGPSRSSKSPLRWERLAAQGKQRRMLDLKENLTCWSWQLLPDWRARLLRWVEVRLNRVALDTTSFDAHALLNWLDHFDPHAQWLPATSDMLQIALVMHRLSERQLPEADVPAAGRQLAQSLFGDMDPAAREAHLTRLVKARWDRRNRPWQGPLSLAEWLDLDRPTRVPVGRSDLEAIAKGSTPAQRMKAAQRTAELVEAGDPDALLASGLLRNAGLAGMEFAHVTLARLAVRDLLLQRMTGGSPAAWALDCYDASRRPLVDAALDALAWPALLQIASRLRLEDVELAVGIAASEALFLAMSRRIASGQVVPEETLSVAGQVLSRLDFSDGGQLAEPWSRPCSSEDEKLEWITACWAWSLMHQPPESAMPSWQFPGWSASLPEPPWWLEALTPPEIDAGPPSPAWLSFLHIVDEWLKDMEQPPDQVPPLLHMGLLTRAAHGVWPADPAWWQGLGSKSALNLLLERFERAGMAAAGRLWPSFIRYLHTDVAKDRWRELLSPLWPWMLERLEQTPASALTDLNNDDLLYLLSVPETLPAPLRAALLQYVVTQKPELIEQSSLGRQGFAGFGREVASTLGLFLRQGRGEDTDFERGILNWFAVLHLWNWAPEEAVRLLDLNAGLRLSVRAQLLQEAPITYLSAAIEALRADPTLLDSEDQKAWIRRLLPEAGQEAPRLLALMC